MELCPGRLQGFIIPVRCLEQVDRVACGLEFRGDDIAGLSRSDGERDQGGRHVQIQEGARHGVLAADGGYAQADLRLVCAQQGGEGLAPTGGFVSEPFKILLEGEINLGGIAAGGDHLSN